MHREAASTLAPLLRAPEVVTAVVKPSADEPILNSDEWCRGKGLEAHASLSGTRLVISFQWSGVASDDLGLTR